MDRDEAIRILQEHEGEIRARGVKRLALFGSIVRDAAAADSDVDVLVDFDKRRKLSLIDYAGLERYLSDILGREVEVAQRTRLKPFLKDNILAEAVEIFPDFGRRFAPPNPNPRPRRSPRQRLQDILDAISAVERLTAGKTLTGYTADPDLVATVERYIERLSEASRHLPDELKAQHPAVPWADIAGIGNILRHGYPDVDQEILWNVATRDLPPLRRAVEAMIRDVDRREGR